jgi:two-component system chemotaxis response regulator CheB
MTGAHPIVVIGASSGGLDALRVLVAALPTNLAASVLVVLHTQEEYRASLPEILSRHGPLRAVHPVLGERLEPGLIYVAPPDNHLLVRAGYVDIKRGPTEDGYRPSVDVLLRSAAAVYGPQVIGVVLTGQLDCGTAGLLSVKARGGIAVVQDPEDAVAPQMPASALRHVAVDYSAPIAEMGALIARLVNEPATGPIATLPREILELEGGELGASAEIVCPHCAAHLTYTEVAGYHRFRCHVGHAFSMESLVREQAETVERAMWAAVRALEESADLSVRLTHNASGDLRARFTERAEQQQAHADMLRELLLSGEELSTADLPSRSELG